MKIYKFCWDMGRQGSVEGLFAAEPSAIEDAIGKEVYFGEILGKHSEVYGALERHELEELPIDDEIVAKLVEHTGVNISGYNPLDYLGEEDDE